VACTNPFAKGNQLAAGSSYDLQVEAKALDDWSKRDDATAMVGFCVSRDIYPQRVYEWVDQCPRFAEAFKMAKVRIAHRIRERVNNNDKDKPHNYGIFMREIGFHDKFLHDYEEDVKDKDAKRSKDIAQAVSQDTIAATAAVLKQLLDQRTQSQSLCQRESSLKIDDSSIRTDR